MTNYRVASRSSRVLAVMMVAILAAVPSAMAQQRTAQPPKSVRLYVFDCGSLNIPDTSPYQLAKEELATTYMSVPCFLVAHPNGPMIWDAGAVPDSDFKPGGEWAGWDEEGASPARARGRERVRGVTRHAQYRDSPRPV